MSGSYASNKASIIRWRQKNKEKLNDLHRGYARIKYEREKMFDYDRICKRFRAICI